MEPVAAWLARTTTIQASSPLTAVHVAHNSSTSSLRVSTERCCACVVRFKLLSSSNQTHRSGKCTNFTLMWWWFIDDFMPQMNMVSKNAEHIFYLYCGLVYCNIQSACSCYSNRIKCASVSKNELHNRKGNIMSINTDSLVVSAFLVLKLKEMFCQKSSHLCNLWVILHLESDVWSLPHVSQRSEPLCDCGKLDKSEVS